MRNEEAPDWIVGFWYFAKELGLLKSEEASDWMLRALNLTRGRPVLYFDWTQASVTHDLSRSRLLCQFGMVTKKIQG